MMQEHDLRSIQQCLRTLERRQRFTLIGWVSSLVIVLLGAVAAQVFSQPEVLRARGLEIVDDAGKVRIALSVDRVPGMPSGQRGISGVWIMDGSGTHLAALNSTPAGVASLTFLDPAHPLQFGGVSLDGLIISDRKGRGRVQVSPDALSVWDVGRRMRLLLALHEDQDVGLTLFDPTGRLRGALDVNHHGSPALTLFDSTGQKRFSAP